MTPDIAADPLPLPETQIPSTAGMTTKVVKGSIWTLGGQVVPLFATLITTPFVIRFLGSESYGVLILVGLIPNYFAFADFGMGMASTKFGSEAYGKGDTKGEGEVVRTSALIAFISSFLVALPLIIFADNIVSALNVPEHLFADATLGLRLTSISFIFAILSNVFNTPQLARLRMDLNAIINASGRVVLAFGTVAVLFAGGSIAGAAAFGLVVAFIVLVSHLLVSNKLLKGIFAVSFNRELIRPLLRFGAGLLISGIAAILLVNLEKLVLTRLTSVQTLAYYSVAFTFASMATLYSNAMAQSLVPAFSQLLASGKKREFDGLFSRCIRINLFLLLPGLTFMFVAAEPFFTIWAGEEFGQEASVPFYILLFGLFFNILAAIPYATIIAEGRTDVFAKLYWIELVIYVFLAVGLISWFGIAGAAAAWSIRVILDAFIIVWFSKRIADVPLTFFPHFKDILFGWLILSPAIIGVVLGIDFVPWILVMFLFSTGLYSMLIWRLYLEKEEKTWIKGRVETLLRFA